MEGHSEQADPALHKARLDDVERLARAVVEDADLHEALPYYCVGIPELQALAAVLGKNADELR